MALWETFGSVDEFTFVETLATRANATARVMREKRGERREVVVKWDKHVDAAAEVELVWPLGTVCSHVLAPIGVVDDASRARTYAVYPYVPCGDLAGLLLRHRDEDQAHDVNMSVDSMEGTEGEEVSEERVALAESVLACVGCALSTFHAHGVVHRDVKPANILVATTSSASSASGRFVLADFGLAALMEDGVRGGGGKRFQGSVAYASPQALGGEGGRGEADDVWSLGVVVYECVFGRLPFGTTEMGGRELREAIMRCGGRGGGEERTLPQVLASDPGFDRVAGLAPELAAFLMSALSPVPSDRQLPLACQASPTCRRGGEGGGGGEGEDGGRKVVLVEGRSESTLPEETLLTLPRIARDDDTTT